MAIRWHMGGFDDAARGGCFAISEAYDKYPLAVKLHIADLEATYLMEHRTSAVREKRSRRSYTVVYGRLFCVSLLSTALPKGEKAAHGGQTPLQRGSV